ncbi:hypothetical protein N7509_009361 [Penicillium cosmopolitanum]|uniref:Uncharacterized protein n=1 Tax=Penicillium cosmopolitanum TaxID=1131564 RepID=A0A9W9VPC6_9EURO|nr:uncharacterized protein N7509_009361 [Penicillium cosmopolitanum]KAJ5386820.1 hypothetical protein N7509_009361 [Penicillium cosmopolitanum]
MLFTALYSRFIKPNDTWIATLTAGLLGTVSGVFGTAAAAIPGLVKSGAIVAANAGENAAARSGVTANLFGAGAGASSQGNGIANSMMQDAASVYVYIKVPTLPLANINNRIQGELNNLSNLEDYMWKLLNFTQFAFYSWGHNALFKTAKNTGYNTDEQYINTPGNLVDILRDGGFASNIEPESLLAATMYDNSMLKFMWGSAIGYLWSTSRVVIYRISDVTEWIEDDDDYTPPDGPCPLEPWETDYQVAVCDEDTGSMYILQALGSNLKGTDRLSQYGLSVLDMARYANLTQSTYGFTKWLTDASAKKIQTNIIEAPVNATPPFVGIPVCDLDALKPLWMAERARDQWYDDNKDMKVFT